MNMYYGIAVIFFLCLAALPCCAAAAYITLAQPSSAQLPSRCFTQPDSLEAQRCRTVVWCLGSAVTRSNDSFRVPVTPSDAASLRFFTQALSLSAGPTKRISAGQSLGQLLVPNVSTATLSDVAVGHTVSDRIAYPPSSPFEVTDVIDIMSLGLEVNTNATCMFFALPRLPMLDVVLGSQCSISFDLGFPRLFTRRLEHVPDWLTNRSAMTGLVWVQRSPPEDELVVFPYVVVCNLFLSVVTIPARLPPALPAAIVGTVAIGSGCTQQNLREPINKFVAWAITSFSGPGETAAESLWRCCVVMVGFLAVHLAALAATYAQQWYKQRRLRSVRADEEELLGEGGVSVRDRLVECASVCRFPSLSIAWWQVWLGPITFAAVATMRDADAARRLREEGTAGSAGSGASGGMVERNVFLACVALLLAVAFCVLPVLVHHFFGLRVWYMRRERLVHDAVCALPDIVVRFLPRTIWGPTCHIRSWSTPFASCRESTISYCMLPWQYLVVQLVVLTPWASMVASCIAQQCVCCIICAVYVFLVIKKRPYRARTLGVLSVAQEVLLVVALVLNMTRLGNAMKMSGSVMAAPEQAIQTIFALHHSIGIARGLLSCCVWFLESSAIRPVVWPMGDSSLHPLQRHFTPRKPSGTSDLDDVATNEAIELLQSLQSIVPLEGEESKGMLQAPAQSRRVSTVGFDGAGSVSDERVRNRDAMAADDAPEYDDGSEEDLPFINEGRFVHKYSRPVSSPRQGGHQKQFFKPRSSVKGSTTSKGPVERAALLREAPVWLDMSASAELFPEELQPHHRKQRRSSTVFLQREDATDMAQVAAAEQSRILLRGPVEKILRGEALRPPGLDAHLADMIDRL